MSTKQTAEQAIRFLSYLPPQTRVWLLSVDREDVDESTRQKLLALPDVIETDEGGLMVCSPSDIKRKRMERQLRKLIDETAILAPSLRKTARWISYGRAKMSEDEFKELVRKPDREWTILELMKLTDVGAKTAAKLFEEIRK